MEKFTASRLSDGNKIFPPEIHLDEQTLTVKMPGLFNGKSQTFNYGNISSVSVHTPLVGYSTITFYAAGTKVSAHGFTKAEVKRIQSLIEEGKSNAPEISSTHSHHSSDRPQSMLLNVKAFMHKSDADMERIERRRQERIEGAKTVLKGVGNILNGKKIKEALDLHNELMGITDDIDIAINQGKTEIVMELVKKLNHPSSLNLPDGSDTYMNFWMKKRKEYISKIS